MTGNEIRPSIGRRKRSGRFRRGAVLIALSEFGLVVGCVGVFFVFLTVLIRVYFPQGTALGDNRVWSAAVLPNSGKVELEYGSRSSFAAQIFAGEILTIQRRVQRRGANSLAWNEANVGDTFTQNDAVQTFAKSTALLKINEESRITIGQNSLIVFEKRAADPFVAKQGSVMVMIGGELSGRLTNDDNSPFQFGVSLPNGDVTLLRRPGDDAVEFLITVNDDQSTTINLHGGVAEIVGRGGNRTTISENQSVTIDASGTQLMVSNLPSAPRSTGPVNREIVTYRNVPETIDFTWDTVADADRYHLVIARDAEFSERVVDDDIIGNSFRHGALGPGSYYWHVRSRVAWSQSQVSTVRRLQVVQDTVPPTLELESPPATVTAGQWRLHGKTDSGAHLYVDDSPASHDNGLIDYAIVLRPGANIIVVKAMDDVGNLSYASISVNAK